MKTKNIILQLLLMLTTISAFGQQSNSKKGDIHYNRLAYAEAIEAYLNDIDKVGNSAILYRNLADSYYNNAELVKASKWFAKYVKTTGDDISPEFMFKYAQTLKAVKRYKAADKWMSKFNKAVPEDARGTYFIENKSYLARIKFYSGRHAIVNEYFNTEAPEFAPAYFEENKLLFSSVRDSSGVRSFDHMWTKSGFTDIYSAPIKSQDSAKGERKFVENNLDSTSFKQYSKVTKKDSLVIKHYSKVDIDRSLTEKNVVKLGKEINSKYNESTAIVSKDGDKMFFTRNNYTNKKYRKDDTGVNRLKLYSANLVEGVWNNVQELPFNSDDYSVAHPTLNVDESRLYFASDMPGSLGLSDIFYVDLIGEDSYGEPINLGDKLNTEGRETYPFISNHGNLYIASDGHVGLGGLDVFSVKYDEFGNVLNVKNLGEPVNSSMDDFGYITNENENTGFFTSNRKTGKGSDDIYSFIKTVQYLSGNVKNETTKENIPNAVIAFKDFQGNVLDSIYTDSKGNYKTEISPNNFYKLYASKDGFSIANDSLQSTNENNKEFIRNFVIKETINEDALCANGINHNPSKECPICATQHNSEKPYYMVNGIKYFPKVNLADRANNKYLIEPIYFDLDKDLIRKDAAVILNKIVVLMTENPSLQIEAHSFCDSRNSGKYNDDLSTRRAKNTIEYLIMNGINPARLNGKAYGESGLVNDCGDGIDCPESKHNLNRRSEFIIIAE